MRSNIAHRKLCHPHSEGDAQRWKASLADIRAWTVTRTISVAPVISLFEDTTQARIREALSPKSAPPAVPPPAYESFAAASSATTAPRVARPLMTHEVPLFRLHSPGARDHFYTTSVPECDNAIKRCNYTFEGIACLVSPAEVDGLTPLYRVWGNNDHFFTVDRQERDRVLPGYADEGIACYLYTSPTEDTVPLYRLWNAGTRDHFYTTDGAERERCLSSGWADEGVIGHVHPI